MYILTHSSNLTRISSGELLLESDERPDLPFAFDALYLEEPTDLAFKVLAEEHLPLTENEITACKAFCDTFLDTADYPVFAYDDVGLFVGSMHKSEAEGKGLAFTFPFGPDHPASKWNGKTWTKIRASILDDGSLILDPAHICERCTLALTAAEWAAFPQQPVSQQDEVFRWDFATEMWKDVSDPLVFAFDEADAYVGQHKKTVAVSRGWGWRMIPPDGWPYKNTPDGWQRVEAVIYEDGHYERLPGGIRDDAMLLFTREEWAAWPERPETAHGEIWVWNFVTETWRDVSDPYGCAFESDEKLDAEQCGLYAGDMLRSEAKGKGLGFTLERPAHPVSKWNGTAWGRVEVVFMDNGSVRTHPDTLCERCMVPLTAAEWEAWPRPVREIPAGFGEWHWNFATETWEDHRVTCDLRKILTQMVFWRHKAALERLMPDPFELDELRMAVDELQRQNTNSTAPAPFVDARYPQDSAAADRATLLENLTTRLTTLAALTGRLSVERMALLGDVAACADNIALDAFYLRLQAEKSEGASCLRG